MLAAVVAGVLAGCVAWVATAAAVYLVWWQRYDASVDWFAVERKRGEAGVLLAASGIFALVAIAAAAPLMGLALRGAVRARDLAGIHAAAYAGNLVAAGFLILETPRPLPLIVAGLVASFALCVIAPTSVWTSHVLSRRGRPRPLRPSEGR